MSFNDSTDNQNLRPHRSRASTPPSHGELDEATGAESTLRDLLTGSTTEPVRVGPYPSRINEEDLVGSRINPPGPAAALHLNATYGWVHQTSPPAPLEAHTNSSSAPPGGAIPEAHPPSGPFTFSPGPNLELTLPSEGSPHFSPPLALLRTRSPLELAALADPGGEINTGPDPRDPLGANRTSLARDQTLPLVTEDSLSLLPGPPISIIRPPSSSDHEIFSFSDIGHNHSNPSLDPQEPHRRADSPYPFAGRGVEPLHELFSAGNSFTNDPYADSEGPTVTTQSRPSILPDTIDTDTPVASDNHGLPIDAPIDATASSNGILLPPSTQVKASQSPRLGGFSPWRQPHLLRARSTAITRPLHRNRYSANGVDVRRPQGSHNFLESTISSPERLHPLLPSSSGSEALLLPPDAPAVPQNTPDSNFATFTPLDSNSSRPYSLSPLTNGANGTGPSNYIGSSVNRLIPPANGTDSSNHTSLPTTGITLPRNPYAPLANGVERLAHTLVLDQRLEDLVEAQEGNVLVDDADDADDEETDEEARGGLQARRPVLDPDYAIIENAGFARRVTGDPLPLISGALVENGDEFVEESAVSGLVDVGSLPDREERLLSDALSDTLPSSDTLPLFLPFRIFQDEPEGATREEVETPDPAFDAAISRLRDVLPAGASENMPRSPRRNSGITAAQDRQARGHPPLRVIAGAGNRGTAGGSTRRDSKDSGRDERAESNEGSSRLRGGGSDSFAERQEVDRWAAVLDSWELLAMYASAANEVRFSGSPRMDLRSASTMTGAVCALCSVLHVPC